MAPVLAVGRAGYFYPRSPCGERRPHIIGHAVNLHPISIHALLAESDLKLVKADTSEHLISIHALLAESDTTKSDQGASNQPISIHALLAESDLHQ